MPTLGLCFICKNESEIIRSMLDSCREFINGDVIAIDTGSTDNTIEIIEQWFIDTKIRGRVYEKPWVNYGANRSELLEYCRALGKSDFYLMMDCDDGIDGIIDFDGIWKICQELGQNPPGFLCWLEYNGLYHQRVQIFSNTVEWKYEGVIHEYPVPPSNSGSLPLGAIDKSFNIKSRSCGARSKNPNKHLDDIEMLNIALVQNPEDARTVFYLAQTYLVVDLELSKFYYKKLLDMNCTTEERFHSLTRLVVLDANNGRQWAWKSINLCPGQIDGLILYLRGQEELDTSDAECYAMALFSLTVREPEGRQLYSDSSVYRYRSLTTYAFHAMKAGQYERSVEALTELIENRTAWLAPEQVESYRKNREMLKKLLPVPVQTEEAPDCLKDKLSHSDVATRLKTKLDDFKNKRQKKD